MSVVLRTRKRLWGRAASRCAFPGCDADLSTGASRTLGEEAHIVARKPGGPRGSEPIPGGGQDHDVYENLVLLCPNHHTLIDSNPEDFPVTSLLEMKRTHEQRVQELFDAGTQHQLEVYAGIVDRWAAELDLDGWDDWTSGLLLYGQPSIPRSTFDGLTGLSHWLLRRAWPGTERRLDEALHNFRKVLSDFLYELKRNSGQEAGAPDSRIQVQKFHKDLRDWDPEKYDDLLGKSRQASAIVERLAIELAMATNLVLEIVRERLWSAFRQHEGYVTLTSGPTVAEWDAYTTSLYRYPDGTDPATAYPGLERLREELEHGSAA